MNEKDKILESLKGISRETNRIKLDIIRNGIIGGAWQENTLKSLKGYVASVEKQLESPVRPKVGL